MQCQRCQREIMESESLKHHDETLCEDCYIDAVSPAKACNPWAVYLATRTRDTSGLKGIEGLASIQQEVYEFIKSNDKVTAEEIMRHFDFKQPELENIYATLRHCELIKGQKDNDKVYFVPFKSGE